MPTGILFGQIALVFAIILAGLWGATEWTAAQLGFQAQLGAPWFDLFGWPVYRPWQLFVWWYWYDSYAPDIFNRGGAIAGASSLLGTTAAIALSVWRAR